MCGEGDWHVEEEWYTVCSECGWVHLEQLKESSPSTASLLWMNCSGTQLPEVVSGGGVIELDLYRALGITIDLCHQPHRLLRPLFHLLHRVKHHAQSIPPFSLFRQK